MMKSNCPWIFGGFKFSLTLIVSSSSFIGIDCQTVVRYDGSNVVGGGGCGGGGEGGERWF